jgi:pilus assembly protein CpaE
MSALSSLANHLHGNASNEQLVAFVADDETRSAVSSAVISHWPTAAVHDGGLSAALGALTHESSPPLLVVDFGGIEDPVAALRSLVALCEASTRIVVIGTVNDVATYREMIRTGAADYLVKPLQTDALVAALEGATKRSSEAAATDARKARVVGVIGVRGGVGASTVALNTAWLLAHEMNKTVGLLDLDLQFGTISLSLDLEPSRGLREVFEKPDRIDSLFVASAMAHESERLYVLSTEEGLEDHPNVNPIAFGLLLNALPKDFDCVVVDLPSRFATAHRNILSSFTSFVLVSDASLAGMRDCVRLAKFLRETTPEAAVHVIVNRIGAMKKGEIPKSEFQRGIDMPVKHFISFDPRIAATAATAGKPLAVIAKRSQIVNELRKIAASLVAERIKAPKEEGGRGGLSSLFGKKKKN